MPDAISQVLLLDYALAFHTGSEDSPLIAKQSFLSSMLRKRGISFAFPKARISSENHVEPALDQLVLEHLKRSRAAIMEGIPRAMFSREILDAILRRISEGMRVWAPVPMLRNLKSLLTVGSFPPAHLYKEFLDAVGIELTDIGLFRVAQEFDHPRCFSIERRTSPASFRHPELFRGVDRLLFQQAHALRLHGEAQAVAAVDLQDFDVVDMKSDLIADWSEPDFPMMAISYVGDAGGCVIATSGLAFRDAYTGPLGHRFPGGEENEQILGNLMSVLQPKVDRERLSDELDVHRLIQSIERNLLEVVRAVLGAEWPECIDPSVRSKAEERAAAGKGVIPWWAYLDLSDHLNTIGKNLPRFQEVLQECGFPTSRNKVESEVLQTGKLIKLRILDSHMTKRVIMAHQFSQPELAVLYQIDRNVIRLWREAKGLT